MDYKRFGDTILVRMDRGEEILEQVKAVALKEQVTLASVQALGAINDFTVGVYNVAEKKYYANDFKGSFEIVSLIGTIDTMNDGFYCHLHLSAGNEQGHICCNCEILFSILSNINNAYIFSGFSKSIP